MTRKEIAKDFFSKVVLPVFLAWFLFTILKNGFTKDGVTDYFELWIVCGIPFGIWRLRVWLIPRRYDVSGSIAIWVANFIIGGMIGGVIIVWRLLVAAWYLNLTVYRIATFRKNQVPLVNTQCVPISSNEEE